MIAEVGERLTRIFVERGATYFEILRDSLGGNTSEDLQNEEHGADRINSGTLRAAMSPEELYQMRVALMQQLQ